MPEEPPQLADEVRGLVRSIVTGVLDDAGRIPPVPEHAPRRGSDGDDVLVIHMDNSAATSMKPPIIELTRNEEYAAAKSPTLGLVLVTIGAALQIRTFSAVATRASP